MEADGSVGGWDGDGDGNGRGGPAVRGAPPGQEAWSGSPHGEGLATALGWFSVGLGTLELLAPRQVGRLIGLEPGAAARAVIRAMGVRELGAGLGILANPRSKEWLGTRVGGDLLDIALLTAALAKSEHPSRTLLALGAVLGVSAADLMGTEQLRRSRRAPHPGVLDYPGLYIRKSVTIWAPRAEVYAFWRDFTNLPRFLEHVHAVVPLERGGWRWVADGALGKRVEWEAQLTEDRPRERISWRTTGSSTLYHAGTVHFRDAPRDGGTVVSVEMWYDPPGGTLTAAVLHTLRREPAQQVADDLRRLKQVLETGDVVLSDARLASHPHPAQRMAGEPVELEEAV